MYNQYVVYRYIFKERKENNIYPYMYIGSKSKCIIKDNKIIDNKNNEYIGSSSSQDYYNAWKEERPELEILRYCLDTKEVLKREIEYQIKEQVNVSIKYFNKFIATFSSFTFSDYGTYKHNKFTNIIKRLPTNHEKVLDGTFVGVSKGMKLTTAQKTKIGRKGTENAFYGKQHTNETKELISLKNSGSYEENYGKEKADLIKSKQSKSRKGILKSAEHKKKIGRKGLIMIQNTETLEILRIPKEEYGIIYNTSIWVNPKKINPEKKYKCKYCDTITNKGNLSRWHNENCKKKKEILNEN